MSDFKFYVLVYIKITTILIFVLVPLTFALFEYSKWRSGLSAELWKNETLFRASIGEFDTTTNQ